MTILQSLDSYYHRLPGVAEPGWSREPVGFIISLDPDGVVVDVEPWVEPAGKRYNPRMELVPKWFGRSGSGSTPFFLWDNTGYALGVSKKEGDKVKRDHTAFIEWHMQILADADDDGLIALRKFLEGWVPDLFIEPHFKSDFLDQNVVFRLRSEQGFIHQRPAARAIIERLIAPDEGSDKVLCLITGERGPGARLHPKIKNVEGTAAAEVPLVSFNKDAFESYGKEQGENAPTSAAAAFRYGAALNHLLTRDGPNRIRRPIGDATVLFWADASNAKAAEAADAFFAQFLDSDIEDAEEAAKIRELMEQVAAGRPVAELRAGVEPGTRFHILGLSPNAARLSVRYWLTDTLDVFARRLASHHQDLKIDPTPSHWGAAPSVNRLLVNTTALQREYKNIPPLLAGEVMRAVLTGGRYPQSLLAATIIRLRAGDDPASGWHAAVIRAVLSRDFQFGIQQEDVPVSLAVDEPNRAYQLGRLFAVLETAQRMALGRLNATIRDRYFGAASATPASVFPLLLRGAQNHLGKLRKSGKGGWIEREIEDILDKLSLDLPRALPLAEQGRFAIGYYHQRKDQFKARPDAAAELETAESEEQGEEA